MSANSLLATQAYPISGMDTAGAAARVSGDATNVLPASEISLVKTGGMRRKSKKSKSKRYTMGGKRRMRGKCSKSSKKYRK